MPCSGAELFWIGVRSPFWRATGGERCCKSIKRRATITRLRQRCPIDGLSIAASHPFRPTCFPAILRRAALLEVTLRTLYATARGNDSQEGRPKRRVDTLIWGRTDGPLFGRQGETRGFRLGLPLRLHAESNPYDSMASLHNGNRP